MDMRIDKNYAGKMLNFLKQEIKQESFIGSFLRNRPDRILWFKLRYLYWKKKLRYLGKNVKICTGILFTNPQRIWVGNDFTFFPYSSVECGNQGEVIIKGYGHLGTGARIQSMGKVIIGKGVEIGANAMIFSHTADTTHGFLGPVPEAPRKKFTTIIEDNCQIGAGSIILGGSHIHKGAIIGAGAVVKGEIEKYAIAVGIPAKKIKSRID